MGVDPRPVTKLVMEFEDKKAYVAAYLLSQTAHCITFCNHKQGSMKIDNIAASNGQGELNKITGVGSDSKEDSRFGKAVNVDARLATHRRKQLCFC